MNKKLVLRVQLMLTIALLSVSVFVLGSETRVQNSRALDGLEPYIVWDYFKEITYIPRGSSNEAAIARFIMDQAAKNNLVAVKDSIGNVIVQKPASDKKYEQAPIIVIQSHMDMVCEKNKNVVHDFLKDPIKLIKKDNYLYADGTTLGADNGIGVATSLALMASKNLVHGPLEFLFTVMEESGFDGANNITASSIKGRTLINIDTEENGILYIGCAGSCATVATVPVTRQALEGSTKYIAITVDGLRGGHSGVDIDKDRVSGLKLASKLLHMLHNVPYRLVSLDGGNKRNAIARDFELVIAIPENQQSHFEQEFLHIKESLLSQYKSIEKQLNINKKYVESKDQPFDLKTQENIIYLLDIVPHGVIKMSADIKELVETSTNLARISTTKDTVVFETMQRSMVANQLKKCAFSIDQIFKSAGARVVIEEGSPEWEPKINSPVLKTAQDVYYSLYKKPAEIKAIHAGLECGAFVNHIPGLDTVSFGPTIHDAHSPSEHIDVTTVKPFWDFLTALLGHIAQKQNTL